MTKSFKARLARLEKTTLGPGGFPMFHWADLDNDSPAAARRRNAAPGWWVILAVHADDDAMALEARGEHKKAAEALAEADRCWNEAAVRWEKHGHSGREIVARERKDHLENMAEIAREDAKQGPTP